MQLLYIYTYIYIKICIILPGFMVKVPLSHHFKEVVSFNGPHGQFLQELHGDSRSATRNGGLRSDLCPGWGGKLWIQKGGHPSSNDGYKWGYI